MSTLPNETDGFLATLLVLAILGQTLLGTLVRQMDVGLMIHLSVAMLVAVLAILVGVRLWGLYPQIAVFARGGVALMGVVILQLILGGISLVFRTPPRHGFAFRRAVASPGRCLAARGPCDPDDGPSDDGRRVVGDCHAVGVLGLAVGGDAGASAAAAEAPAANAETVMTV